MNQKIFFFWLVEVPNLDIISIMNVYDDVMDAYLMNMFFFFFTEFNYIFGVKDCDF